MPFKTQRARTVYMRAYRARKRTVPRVVTFPDATSDPVTALCEWSRSHLIVPPGHPLEGRPFVIPPYGEAFLRDALAPDCLEGFLCLGRKNAKSAIVAVLILGHLVGPLRRPGWRAGVASVSKEKAGELKKQCEAIATASNLEGVQFLRSPAPGRIVSATGSVDILAAEGSAGAAAGVDLAIVDEIGLLKERDRKLVNSMRSSVSAKRGRFLSLSIFGDAPFTKEIVARRGAPGLAIHHYFAPDGCAVDDEDAFRAANPGIEAGIKGLDHLRSEARRVLSSVADIAHFRAHELNQELDPTVEMLCALADFEACVVHAQDMPGRDGEVVVGFDLGGSSSMTALAACWPRTGRVETWGAFPATPSLEDRGTADGVGNKYSLMEKRGEMKLYQGRITPVGEFLKDCAARLAGERVLVAGADRFRKAEALQAIETAGLNWPMTWRGMGAAARADGSHDVRATQKLILSRQLRTTQSLLLESAIKESAIRRDALGNPSLSQARKKGRIDVLSALTIAVGLADLVKLRPRHSWRSRGAVAA